MSEFVLDWVRYDKDFVAKTADEYVAAVARSDNPSCVRLVGYLAAVEAPGWYYTGSFATRAAAQSWCRHIIARDRRAPMQRNGKESANV